jgi:hypothetical protein
VPISKKQQIKISLNFDKLLKELMGKAAFRTKLSTLKKLIDYVEEITCTKEQQKRYVKALEELYSESRLQRRDVLIIFQQLIKKSVDTTLLSEEQKNWAVNSLIPRIQKINTSIK